MNKRNIFKLLEILQTKYPNPKSFLNFTNNFELLIAAMLSAQCTDKLVNKVSLSLFPFYNTPQKMLELGEKKLKIIIKSVNYYNTKAKNIIALSKLLVKKYNGILPSTLNELLELPGVGRKTANVVLAQAFGIPAFPVDTHIFRVTNRFGLVKAKNPLQAEEELCKIIPRELWINLHLQLISHGKETCTARLPKCYKCKVVHLCEWKNKNFEK
jgi:endonuclease-3